VGNTKSICTTVDSSEKRLKPYSDVLADYRTMQAAAAVRLEVKLVVKEVERECWARGHGTHLALSGLPMRTQGGASPSLRPTGWSASAKVRYSAAPPETESRYKSGRDRTESA